MKKCSYEENRLRAFAIFDKWFPPSGEAPVEPIRDSRTWQQKELDKYRMENDDEHTQTFINSFDDLLEDRI